MVKSAAAVSAAQPAATEKEGLDRRPFTFLLDAGLVEDARRQVGESEMVRSMEAALIAAIDYQNWVREVKRDGRGVLS